MGTIVTALVLLRFEDEVDRRGFVPCDRYFLCLRAKRLVPRRESVLPGRQIGQR